MSRIEKIIVIALILLVLAGVALSYYNKLSRERIRLVPVDIKEQNEKAQNIIAARKIIDINTADKHTLTKLSGIGPKLAQRIVDYRRESGRFNSSDELMKVKGIGPKKYEFIKKYVRVD